MSRLQTAHADYVARHLNIAHAASHSCVLVPYLTSDAAHGYRGRCRVTSVAVTTQLEVRPLSEVVTYSKALPYSIFFVIAWDTCRQWANDKKVVHFLCTVNLEVVPLQTAVS